MKKILAFTCISCLAVACYLVMGVAAEDEATLLGGVTPEGYDYTKPEEESPESCAACAHQRDNHLWRVLGAEPPETEEHAPQSATVVTGIGWLSSAHATSFIAGVNNNSYCAWCHAPTTYKVTSNANDASVLKPGKWHAMSCAGCHTTHHIAGEIGTRYTNYYPGHDLEEEESYIPRHAEKGRQANKQCLWCHGDYHGFSSRVKTAMVKSGSLRCIDCHMAGYQLTDRGTVERYHNMKVIENLPFSCNGRFGALVSCHSTAKKNWGLLVVPKIYDAHTTPKHKLPGT